MQLIKRVTQLAKDRALIKFSALVGLMLQDADEAIVRALNQTRSGINQYTLSAALQFLRRERTAIQSRIDTLFKESVDRGLRTMYTDLRQDLSNLSANTLTLIDDETVNKQLEVGHLVQRLRDSCDENLGRLNIMIAHIHGVHNVNERENPFRPYFIARALYETLKEKAPDEDIAKVLFEHLSNSLASRLSHFYGSICEVFDSNGVQARLLALPTKLKAHQRDQLAQQLAARKTPASFASLMHATSQPLNQETILTLNARMLPLMEKMFRALQKEPEPASQRDPDPRLPQLDIPQHYPVEELQQFIWKVFNQAQSSGLASIKAHSYLLDSAANLAEIPASGMFTPASPQLLSQLDKFQQLAAASDPVSGPEQNSPDNQLFSLGEKLVPEMATQGERLAIDVVAMLFEFILEDEQIPAATRVQIGRLQIPILKASILEPELLQQAEHPARQLLNRMSSAAVGRDATSTLGQKLDSEIARLVKRVLKEFDKDVAIFTDCLNDLNHFLATHFVNADEDASRSIEAAQEAEKQSILFHNTGLALLNILEPLMIDQRAVDFIVQIWARVLVRAAAQTADASSSAVSIGEQYRDVLPELVWSVQEKKTPEERNLLIRLLPGLVKRLKIGMLMIHLSEQECKDALDRLVPVHTQVLRTNFVMQGDRKLPSLDELRKEFTRLVISDDSAAWTLGEPIKISEAVMEGALADRGVEADLSLQPADTTPSFPDSEFLAQIQLGTCVQFWAADTCVLARVIWISKYQSLFIFKMEQNAKPMVYSAASLLQALQSGKIRPVEYAPAFDRAVDALILGVEAVQAART